MRFKRPQVRYADTPQPATPYQSAAQVWDDRIGWPACKRRTGARWPSAAYCWRC